MLSERIWPQKAECVIYTVNKKLYVGNLPYSTTEDELKQLCSKFGAVESAAIIMDKYSGRSKGFGFVEMSTEAEAQEVIKQLDGSEMDGRKVVVNEARPLTKREG